MGNQKIVKIFVASSLEEFEFERAKLGMYVLGLNNKFRDKGFYFELELCENIENSMYASGRKQDQYNEFIKNADFVFVLFFKKVGQYTVEEFDLARKMLEENGKPKIYVYFQETDKNKVSKEILEQIEKVENVVQHYYGTFDTIETVEHDLIRALAENYIGKDSIYEEDGYIYVDGAPIMSIESLDCVKNNAFIARLKAELAGLRSGDPRYTAGLYGSEIDDEIEHKEKQLKSRYSMLFSAMRKRFENLTDSKYIDPELQLAMDLMTKGDYEKVLDILKTSEVKLEADGKIMQYKANLREAYEITFKKYESIIISAQQTNNYDALYEAFPLAVELIQAMHLYEYNTDCLITWYDYACFLYNQNKTEKAYDIAKGLLSVYDFQKNKDNYDYGILLNLLGVICDDLNKKDETEFYYLESIRIREQLAKDNPDEYSENLAMCYNNAGIFYYDQGNPEKTEFYYLEAIKIYKQLAKDNPYKFSGDLAMGYNNAGNFYSDQGNSEKAELYYLEAIKIYKQLAKDNPDKYSGNLASSYNNVGIFYYDQGNTEKAEPYYLETLKMGTQLAKDNPDKFSGNLATSYNNAGTFYYEQGNLQKAEFCYLEAIRIREQLAKDNPDKFSGDLAMSYNNAGNFYSDQGNPEKAEAYYLEAIRIREQLAKDNPDKFSGDLAASYNNVGVFYRKQGNTEKAKFYYLEAIRIRDRLANDNPDRYSGFLANSYFNFALFINDDSYLKKAYELALKSQHSPISRRIIEILKDEFSED